MSRSTYRSPWNFSLKNAGNGFIVRDCAEAMICDVFMTNRHEIAEARGRLIAAAPDLLEACKAAREYLNVAEKSMLAKLDAAIAKAEGRQ